jgi:hypothetical protein
MFDKLKGVTRSVRNLPQDPAVDPGAPATEPDGDEDGMTCPSCGAAFSLQAVAKPTAAPVAEPAQAPPVSEGPGF